MIGILALQGDFSAHERSLQSAGFSTKLVKYPEDLRGLDGLVLPGGESTTMIHHLKARNLWEPLNRQVQSGLKVFATCAGAILAASKIVNPDQESFGWVPITVTRNGYGDQRFSFESQAQFQDQPLKLVFIRAPQISSIESAEVKVHLKESNHPVLIEYRNLLLATFHPELTQDSSIYRYWFRNGDNSCRAYV